MTVSFAKYKLGVRSDEVTCSIRKIEKSSKKNKKYKNMQLLSKYITSVNVYFLTQKAKCFL